MSEPLSPIRDPTFVKLIVDTVTKLTKERLAIDKKIVETAHPAEDNNTNFSILNKLADLKTDWRKIIDDSRDVASKYISNRLIVFVEIKLALVEKIDTTAKCQNVIISLAKFAQEETPLVENSLRGIDAVAKAFGEIWSAVGIESLAIVNILGKIEENNLKESIQALTESLAPIKRACVDIGAAVDKYATATPP